ncbi:hypothetical protein [Pseudomonas nitroreducens]|uniref:hypothetical protein n=1 Tax=Pseudomonas nitroreducens TaxID=46680 RepID=UPI002658FB22|nr:hypothetical protein [Pseudomonas nitroreducens]MCP1647254.1 DNA gyrase inhibitor GyrI [Pseudomonas nitroreducens]MCP1685830.1 DNA gyrase inhibitor GyrI [Pseudomonas nitroreducens]
MEEWLNLMGTISAVLSSVSVLISIIWMNRRLAAERHFVDALKNEIEQTVAEEVASDGEVALPDGVAAPLAKPSLIKPGSIKNRYVRYRLVNTEERLREKRQEIYNELLRFSEEGVKEHSLVLNSLKNLSESDRKKIKRTLDNNTDRGRVRYLSVAFRNALRNAN